MLEPLLALLLLAPAQPSCRADGWCWVNPTPQGNDLLDVWAASPGDAWAVGERGTLLHWDGTRWALEGSGVPERLRAVSGRAPDDVWAVGDEGQAIHWDGHGWQSQRLPEKRTLTDVWVSASGQTWAVGDGVVAHRDASGWKVEERPGEKLQTVFGLGDHDVWIGGGKTFERWDGAHWSPVALPGDLKGTVANPVRVRGAAGQLFAIFAPVDEESQKDLDAFAWDGHAWSRLPAQYSAAGGIWALVDLWAPAPDRVWLRLEASREPVAPYHFERAGGRWTQLPDQLEGMNPSRFGGSGDSDGWVVGGCGAIAHWDGAKWRLSSANPAVREAKELPDPENVHWLSLGRARLSAKGDRLWLEGRWPAFGQPLASGWFRVDLEHRTFERTRKAHGATLKESQRLVFENRQGDRWELHHVGRRPNAATVVVHSIAGSAQPPVAFPRLEGAFVDSHGAFWGWGECGTVVTQKAGSGR